MSIWGQETSLTFSRDVAQRAAARGWIDRLFAYTFDEPKLNQPAQWQTIKDRARALHQADSRLRSLVTTRVQSADDFGIRQCGSPRIEPCLDLFTPTIRYMDNKPTGREPGSEVPGGAETRPIFTKPGRIRRCRSFLTMDRDDFKLDYAPASATVTPGGTYSVTVRGVSGSLIREGISTLTVTAATPETPVSESFDRSDSTNLGSGWNEYLADFGIRGNEVSNLDAAGQEAKHVSLRETGGCETGVLPFFSGKILLLAGKRSMNRLRGVCRFLLRSEAVKAY